MEEHQDAPKERKPRHVEIFLAPDPSGPLPVWHNGTGYVIERGRTVTVPRHVAQVLVDGGHLPQGI